MRRLERDSQAGVFGGVAAGLGRYFDVDPVIVRIGFVLLALANGLGLLLYVAGWLLMPERRAAPAEPVVDSETGGAPEGMHDAQEAMRRAAAEIRDVGQRAAESARETGQRVAESAREAKQRMTEEWRQAAPSAAGGRTVAGVVLIVVGALLLVDRLPWLDWPDWARLGTLWPLVLVVIGVGVIIAALRETSRDRGGS